MTSPQNAPAGERGEKRRKHRRRHRKPPKKREHRGSTTGSVVTTASTEPVSVSPSLSAPAGAYQDFAAMTSEQEMESFFGSGHGPALHYDRGAQTAEDQSGEEDKT